jgi:hypothetical protein
MTRTAMAIIIDEYELFHQTPFLKEQGRIIKVKRSIGLFNEPDYANCREQ